MARAKRTSTRAASARRTPKQPPVLGPRGQRTRPRPLRGEPAIARRYDPGFREPRPRDPWVDEGHPPGE
jgi:hypothetical protein